METGKGSFPILCSLESKELVIDSSFLECYVLEWVNTHIPKGSSRQPGLVKGVPWPWPCSRTQFCPSVRCRERLRPLRTSLADSGPVGSGEEREGPGLLQVFICPWHICGTSLSFLRVCVLVEGKQREKDRKGDQGQPSSWLESGGWGANPTNPFCPWP